MRVLLEGSGAVGARAARQLVEAGEVTRVHIAAGERSGAVAAACGPRAVLLDAGAAPTGVAVAVLAGHPGGHGAAARRHLAEGRAVVSVSPDLRDVQELLDLDAEARARGVAVVAGAGFSPGLSCLLARHAARALDEVEEIHVARLGTGGPACARQRRRSLTGRSLDWRDHRWERHRAGTGRQLCWFPDPVGGWDCFRAELPDASLLVPAFPGVARVTARIASTRVGRVAARLRLPRRYAPEGELGALRVEVRGRRAGASEVVVLGALDRPAVAAGAVAALAALAAARGDLEPGAAGLAALADPGTLLAGLATVGIKAAVFEGT